MGTRSGLRAPTLAPWFAYRFGPSAVRRPLGSGVQTGRNLSPTRDLAERVGSARGLAADVELVGRARSPGRCRPRHSSLPRRQWRAERRGDCGVGSKTRLPAAEADLDDPLSGIPGAVEQPEATALQR